MYIRNFLSLIFICLLSLVGISQERMDRIITPSGKSITHHEIKNFLHEKMDSLQMPGLSIAIINNGEMRFYENMGMANRKLNIPVDKKTLFDAGSLSKPVFAYYVLHLVDTGFMDLDYPLYNYLPNPDLEEDERYKEITARMILSHTSGLPNWRFLEPDGKLSIKFEPGSSFNYSGEGYQYLADVVAKLHGVSRDSLELLINENLFSELDMERSFFTWNDTIKNFRAQGYVEGEPSDGWALTSSNPNFNAAASLQTNVLDYTAFLKSILKQEYLSEELYTQMGVKEIETEENPDEYWGLGFRIRETEYGKQLEHTGYNLSFSSAFAINPQHDFAYVFFCNNGEAVALNNSLRKFFTNE